MRELGSWLPEPAADSPTHCAADQAIITVRASCALRSRKVFLTSSSSAVGCTYPSTSVAREATLCSPGVAPLQV